MIESSVDDLKDLAWDLLEDVGDRITDQEDLEDAFRSLLDRGGDISDVFLPGNLSLVTKVLDVTEDDLRAAWEVVANE